MKRKTITLVVYMLVCISLVSVGFAAWVITGGDQSTTTGGITASQVQDKSLTITDEKWLDQTNPNAGEIAFGAPKTYTNGNNWLQIESGTITEDLVAVYQFVIGCDSAYTLEETVNTATITYSDTSDQAESNLKKCIDAGYITAATVSYRVNAGTWYKTTDASTSLAAQLKAIETNSATVEIKIEYSWGFKKGGNAVNPFDYYAGTTASDNAPILVDGETQVSYKEQAKNALGAIYAANGTAMSLVIDIKSVTVA